MKTRGGTARRFKKTAGGLKYKHAFKGHILTKMTTKRKRQLRSTSMLNKSGIARVERSLHLR